MSGETTRRGGLPVGHVDDLDPLEASVVAALRLWQAEDTTAAAGVARAMDDLLRLCQTYGRRPLLRHSAGCPCLGADEACLARLVATATAGDANDAMLIATLVVRPDVAAGMLNVARALGVELDLVLRRSMMSPHAARETPPAPHRLH